MTRMEPERFRWVARKLVEANWIFAKTMPQTPHYYTLRREWVDKEFVDVVKAIRAYGYTEYYPPPRGRPYTMLNVNEHKYWTMGCPLHNHPKTGTILINRKVRAIPPTPYDSMAGDYDSYLVDGVADVMERIEVPALASVLDIGCGTGRFLDFHQPERYRGIDPSGAMLSRLAQKHPDYAGNLLACRFEEFWCGPDDAYGSIFAYEDGRYDLVVCLFGAANYIDPAYLLDIPNRVLPDGHYHVMFYAPGCVPAHEPEPLFDGVLEALPGERFQVGNYVMVSK